jgi:hypothetical protein
MTPASPGRLKVFGWSNHGLAQTFNGSARVIVATTSFAKACAAAREAGIGAPARDFYAVTSNVMELEVALAQPGQVLATLDVHRTDREYRPVRAGRIVET